MSLIQSVKERDVEAVKRILAGRADVNAVDGYGSSALWYAAYLGDVECATSLLDAKADVHKVDGAGRTALHMASRNGHAVCVRVSTYLGGVGV